MEDIMDLNYDHLGVKQIHTYQQLKSWTSIFGNGRQLRRYLLQFRRSKENWKHT